MADDAALSQGAKGGRSQTLRPVTLKQLREAAPAAGGESFSVESPSGPAELGQVTFVAAVRSMAENNAGVDYVFEDGTGSMSGKAWPDRATGAPPTAIPADTWARVYGTVRAFGDKRSVNVHAIRPVTDFNELTHHFMQVLALSWPHHGKDAAGGPASTADIAGLTMPQRVVLMHCRANAAAVQGLHRDSVARALSGKLTAAEVSNAIDFLISESFLYITTDADHVRALIN